MQATATVTIPVHLRDEALSANGRQHWRVKAARTASLRTKSALLHRDAARQLADVEHLHLTVWITWPDRRHRDAANLHPTIKACVDGYRDALGPSTWDDDDTHLTGPDLRVCANTSGQPGIAILTFVWQPIDSDETSTPVNASRRAGAATNTAGARRAMAALGRREGEETR